MLILKKLSLSLLLIILTFSLTGCGDGETSYSLSDLQGGLENNASIEVINRESTQNIETALNHLELRYGIDLVNSTALMDLNTSDNIVYTTDHKNFEIVDGLLVVVEGTNTILGEYDVKIIVTDAEDKTLETIITIVVLDDINLAPPVITSLTFNFLENTTGDMTVSYETLGKGQVNSFTFAGGVDDALFTIDNTGVLSLNAAVDYDDATTQKHFNLLLQAGDDLGNTSPIQPLEIFIKDVDEGYHFTSQNNFTVLDQSSEVGKITAVPNDASMPAVEYGFVGDTTEFGIGLTSGILRFANAIAYVENGNNTYTVMLEAKNQYNGSETNSSLLTIVVVPNYTLMKPVIDNYESTVTTIPSQEVLIHVIARSQAPDGNVTFDLIGEDASLFEIDEAGNIRFAELEDYYTARDADGDNVFKFAVEVTEDYGNMEPTQEIVITLIEDPAKKKPIITTSIVNISENTLGHEAVSFETPGTGVVNEYIIVQETLGSTSKFTFENGFLSFVDIKPDFETQSIYTVIVRVKDSFGNISEPQEITVNIVNVYETYNFTSQILFSPTEGDSAVGVITVAPKVQIVDAIPSFSIATQTADGLSTSKFQIDTVSGALSFKNTTDSADVGVVYKVTVNVESQYLGSSTTSSDINITVLALDRAITFTPQPVAEVPQNITTPAVEIRATSSDSNAVITYDMEMGTDKNIFNIIESTGDMIITVPLYKWSSDPDANVYRGAVVASDQFGNSKVQQGEMHVLKPFVGSPVFSTTTFTINENTTVVGNIVAVSPIPSSPTLSYKIIGGTDSSLFNINANSAIVSFKKVANFEYKSSYQFIIEVNDNIGHAESISTKEITVNILDVEDAPTNIQFSDGTTTTLAQDGYHKFIFSYNSTTYKKIVATASPSAGDLTYSLTSVSKMFSITASGELKIDAPPSSEGNYDLIIKVVESNGEVSSGKVTVTLYD